MSIFRDVVVMPSLIQILIVPVLDRCQAARGAPEIMAEFAGLVELFTEAVDVQDKVAV
jgi:hypothetical protein